jgi:glycosyltransferase involved in cell wall biosynthesis
MGEAKDWSVVAWAPHSRRSEVFAQELGAILHCIHYLKFQAPLYAPLKYVLQAARTLQVLFGEHPQVVFVQNPPFVCGLMVSLYCRITGTQFVFDHHSAAFASIWDWALPIQKRLARQAAVNIVTNQHWADIVHSWGARALIMGDPFVELPAGETFSVVPGVTTIAFVQTFAPDEPLDAVLAAVSRLPDVHLYVTGDTRRRPTSFFENQPPNVTFTGFLPDSQYIGLLRAVDAILVLTTRDHTLQLGGCEAVSVGKPLIVSDWPFLRQFFSKGTIYVSNSSDTIYQGIREMQRQKSDLQRGILELRDNNRHQWQVRLTQLKTLVAGVNPRH